MTAGVSMAHDLNSIDFTRRTGQLPIEEAADVVAVRQITRRIATGMGFSTTGQTMLVTAASELARNALIYGGGGRFEWEVMDAPRIGIRLTFTDEGPGIPDMVRAMTDGWSSGKGMGLGLTGAKRLCHEFSIASVVGRGTTVAILRWR